MNHTILKIDKTNWKPVKFGDVVAEPKEICKDIVAEGIEHVVGLEHIDTGDVHLRKSATIEESTTFSKKFRKGDVLFGRRRAYLKKAAQADFDGICSGDITVFRAKKEFSYALLPFIVNNDKFFDYAVKHSAGGLSPRVKFKDLANYEFLLPPKAEQMRLAELLRAMVDVIEKEKEILYKNLRLKKAILQKLASSKHGVISNLGDFLEIENGYAFKGEFISDNVTDRILMTPGNFKVGGGFLYDKMKYYKSDDVNTKFIFKSGEMVITMTDLSKDGDTLGYPAFIPEIEGKIILHNQRLGKVVLKNNKLNFNFIYYLLQTPTYRSHILNAATKTTVRHTYANRIKSFKFFQPDDDMQLKWVSKFVAIDQIECDTKSRILSSQSLQKSLINQIF